MLERAIRRTGCSFVFRYARNHPLLHPPRSQRAARARERGRLVADSDNYCRFVAGNPSSRRKQLFSIRGQRNGSISLPTETHYPSSFLSPANARPSPSFVPFLELSGSTVGAEPPSRSHRQTLRHEEGGGRGVNNWNWIQGGGYSSDLS